MLWRTYGEAREAGDSAAMASSLKTLKENYRFFGYGYFKSVNEAIPPVGLTFVMFRIMVVLGSYFLLFFIAVLFMVYRTTLLQRSSWIQWIAMVSVPFMWVCSEAGWAVAEVAASHAPCMTSFLQSLPCLQFQLHRLLLRSGSSLHLYSAPRCRGEHNVPPDKQGI